MSIFSPSDVLCGVVIVISGKGALVGGGGEAFGGSTITTVGPVGAAFSQHNQPLWSHAAVRQFISWKSSALKNPALFLIKAQLLNNTHSPSQLLTVHDRVLSKKNCVVFILLKDKSEKLVSYVQLSFGV